MRPNHRADTVCPENGASLVTGDFGIDLIQGAERRRLVGIAGRARATRDLSPTIGQAFFAPRCAYVVFVHDQYVHVVEVATGRVARLLPGCVLLAVSPSTARVPPTWTRDRRPCTSGAL